LQHQIEVNSPAEWRETSSLLLAVSAKGVSPTKSNKYLLQAMMSFFRTISLRILPMGQTYTKLFAEKILTTCCGLLSLGSIAFFYDNGSIVYPLFGTVAFILCAKQIWNRSLPEKVPAESGDFRPYPLSSARDFFEKSSGQLILRKSYQFVKVLCGFLGNTLLGTLGAEIAGLRGIIQPAVAFLKFSARQLARKMPHHTSSLNKFLIN